MFHIKARSAGPDADAVVLVTTIRALKQHGGKARDTLDQADAEIRIVRERAVAHGVSFAETRHFAEGGRGAQDPAREVMKSIGHNKPYSALYELTDTIYKKVHKVCKHRYGADDVAFTKEAEKDLKTITTPRAGQAAGMHCQGAKLAFRRSVAARQATRFRGHRQEYTGQRRRGFPYHPDGEYHAYARIAQTTHG